MKRLFRHIKSSVLLGGLTILLGSCTEQFNVEVPSATPKLVVEGYVDQLNSTHFLRLSTSNDFTGLGFNSFGRGAEVNLVAGDGTVFPYVEIEESSGLYALDHVFTLSDSDSLQLSIELSNGDIYQSTFQKLPPKINIDSSEVILQQFEGRFGNTVFNHDIKLHFQNSGENQFYSIDNIGFARVAVTYALELPDPLLPLKCWSIRDPINSSQIILGNNLGLVGDTYAETILTIPIDAKDEYIVQLFIRSMSVSNFSIFRDINDQLARNGSLYDRDIAPVIGNITQVNGENVALGYFHVYNTTEQVICYTRRDVAVAVTIPIIPPTQYCVDHWAPATYDDLSFLFCN